MLRATILLAVLGLVVSMPQQYPAAVHQLAAGHPVHNKQAPSGAFDFASMASSGGMSQFMPFPSQQPSAAQPQMPPSSAQSAFPFQFPQFPQQQQQQFPQFPQAAGGAMPGGFPGAAGGFPGAAGGFPGAAGFAQFPGQDPSAGMAQQQQQSPWSMMPQMFGQTGGAASSSSPMVPPGAMPGASPSSPFSIIGQIQPQQQGSTPSFIPAPGVPAGSFPQFAQSASSTSVFPGQMPVGMQQASPQQVQFPTFPFGGVSGFQQQQQPGGVSGSGFPAIPTLPQSQGLPSSIQQLPGGGFQPQSAQQLQFPQPQQIGSSSGGAMPQMPHHPLFGMPPPPPMPQSPAAHQQKPQMPVFPGAASAAGASAAGGMPSPAQQHHQQQQQQMMMSMSAAAAASAGPGGLPQILGQYQPIQNGHLVSTGGSGGNMPPQQSAMAQQQAHHDKKF